MQFKKISKDLLNEFNIGFEFEVFVNNKEFWRQIEDNENKNDKKSEKTQIQSIPKEIKEKYGHLFEVKGKSSNTKHNVNEVINYNKIKAFIIKKLTEKNPEYNWDNSFKLTEESSLTDLNQKTPVEIIYKHEKGKIAYEKLWCMIELFSSPIFYMNKDCGLHINISFVNKNKNLKHLAISATEKIDIKKIQQNFGRQNNEYCLNNNQTESYDIEEDLQEFVCEKLLPSNCTFLKVRNKMADLKKPENMKKFIGLMEEWCKEKFIQEWEDNRPAIAPKNVNGINYLEFRATGGTNYASKPKQINDAILSYLQGMKLAYQLEAKKLLIKKSKNKALV